MRQVWIRRRGSADLIVVFSGWVVGTAPFLHLSGSDDVVVLDDYRDERMPAALTQGYGVVRVVAYSLGVAVAARHLAGLKSAWTVAVCGARQVVGEDVGISPAVYDATAANVTEKGLARFCHRAGVAPVVGGDPVMLRNELIAIAERPSEVNARFDRVVLAQRDRIFTPERQAIGWADHDVRWCDSGHNPFSLWQSWDEVLR